MTFNDLGAGETEVTVTLQYVAPAGTAGDALAGILSDPEERLAEDLRRFKAWVEGPESRAAGEQGVSSRAL